MNMLAFERLSPAVDREARLLVEAVSSSLAEGVDVAAPFRHLRLERLAPPAVLAGLAGLSGPPPLPCLGESTRSGCQLTLRKEGRGLLYEALERAFSAAPVLDLAARCGVEVTGCSLRFTLTHEVDGYACRPRTGQGEARLRIVAALPPTHQHDLGPDLYADPETWVAQPPWAPGSALAFAPAGDTWHGFEPRLIRQIRSCLIIDYVADERRGA
jgi:hypothetical protein